MIPLAVPNLAGREAEYLQECITSTFVSTVGPFVSRFEEMVAAAAGAKHAVATSAGTTALHAALLSVGVERDDLVIAPAFTFIASIASIAHCGALPWLFDVSAETWTIDVRLLADKLEKETCRRADGSLVHKDTGRRVSAILPVFTLGIPAQMDEINELAKSYDLPIVVDAAAALGTDYKGRSSGNLGADFTMFSFNGNKTVTAGGGGGIVTDDPEKARLFRHLTTTARVGANYDHDIVGYNYRMTNLQAAVGCAQMENLDRFVEVKRNIARKYREAFSDIAGTAPFPDPEYARSGHWFSGIVVNNRDPGQLADIHVRLREAGIDSRPFWKPAHLQAPYVRAPRTEMKVCESLWQRIVTLPCSTALTAVDQDYIVDNVRRQFANN
ncbi:aminotransferase class I/II-fold pyridoxal phosphate-dependent enzyme [Rhizobium laguerreae]|uniref:aminotransferase class I/II-fold pyridoxal phosphate-dependent enzyme n=1 Tax=Rhizobium laguerreae TaxID=1076926 RepID=UPI001C9151D1|nr:aminotransferase class I/II-fold pyridoxal phosphate-dependent enzyme [Rhizobium laguerreae]MBY3202266.1 aminotransferase class I/II-fold pyridoxal phosphate-dependent enzyme [Rhizobium laguerreae]MBY3485576.1 aminotransferase class I/II-fold pyridoxal phosphate-dependent enzyme [Rhizobium laguerreae]